MRARERTSLQDIVIAGESPMVFIWRCTAILLGGVVQVALACGHDGINLILEQPFVSFLCVLYIFWVYFIVPTFPPPTPYIPLLCRIQCTSSRPHINQHTVHTHKDGPNVISKPRQLNPHFAENVAT